MYAVMTNDKCDVILVQATEIERYTDLGYWTSARGSYSHCWNILNHGE